MVPFWFLLFKIFVLVINQALVSEPFQALLKVINT